MDVNALAVKLSDPAANVRAEAAEALAHLAEGAQAAAVPLVQAMGDADEDVRNWALAALESLGPPRIEDAPLLSKFAADPRLDVAYWAVMLLGRFGGMSVPAQPQILSALTAALDRHAEIAVRQQAAWALGKFGVAANSARESLSQAAACGDPRLARLAKEAIGNLE
jgi:HEAT repeat protein